MSSRLRHADPEEVGMSAKRIRRIRDLARGWVEQGLTPALVVLAARRGAVVLHDAFGKLGPELDAPPLELDTVFPMASISKAFTAALAMMLVEDGLLGLNRPVQEYVPEFVGEGKDQVMVHHLLTHTSGLEEDVMDAQARRNGEPDWSTVPEERYPSPREWLARRLDSPLTRPPGVEMSYCNPGYEILGEIVQRVGGEQLEAFARRRLFDPLGMADTWFVVPESVDRRVVRRPPDAPYALWDTGWFRRSPFAMGGAFSVASDLAAFGQMLLEGGALGEVRILSQASVAEMTRNQLPGISAHFGDVYYPEATWGLGLCIQGNKRSLFYPSLSSPRTFGHDGAGGVLLSVDPTYDLVCVYFSVQLESTVGTRPCLKWNADLFVNAVTAAIED